MLGEDLLLKFLSLTGAWGICWFVRTTIAFLVLRLGSTSSWAGHTWFNGAPSAHYDLVISDLSAWQEEAEVLPDGARTVLFVWGKKVTIGTITLCWGKFEGFPS